MRVVVFRALVLRITYSMHTRGKRMKTSKETNLTSNVFRIYEKLQFHVTRTHCALIIYKRLLAENL